jgi:hypothetical protein
MGFFSAQPSRMFLWSTANCGRPAEVVVSAQQLHCDNRTRTQMICNSVLVENNLLKSVIMPPLALVTEPDSKLERLLAE